MPATTPIQIGRRQIGPGCPCYLIAEIGANHNGSLDVARQQTRAAAEAGVDAVKFQAYVRETLFIHDLPDDGRAETRHNRELLERRWNILPKFTAPDEWWPVLKRDCDELGVDFVCTPFDLDRLQLLDRLGVPAHKIASGDLTWHELLRAAGATGKPVVLSTGASTENEVAQAVAAFRTAGGTALVLLHCVSNYPPKWEDANLRAMLRLGQIFGVPVGLSDHSPGSTLAVAAVALGACVIEKHITQDRRQEGLDHHFALEPAEFATLVKDVRHTEAALGSGKKSYVTPEEIERFWVRRGLWVATDIPSGTILRREHLTVVRPRMGLGAEDLAEAVGRPVTKALSKGMPLLREYLAD
ncbi:MAG: N,N'-diacetyllegionaminic acid synthase [Verrucomicrobiae bacterium]|nr:N,N'-diacetyllegionaminic acid synthase [Verrucomicrobiae bacterium]